MTRSNSEEAEREAVITVARLMAVSARTAPKARGLDSIKTLILSGDELERLAKAMDERRKGDPDRFWFFKINAKDVRNSMAVALIGVTGEPKRVGQPLPCGACGKSCLETLKVEKIDTGDARGPICINQAMDLGIAIGSAVKTATDHNVDNRVMYSVGASARKLKLLDAGFIVVIPLSATSKNIYFTGR